MTKDRMKVNFPIEPRGPNPLVNSILMVAWIDPEKLKRIQQKKGAPYREEQAFAELLAYCHRHIVHGSPAEIVLGYPPRNASETPQTLLYVRIDNSEWVHGRVEQHMRRKGFHTGNAKDIYLPSERQVARKEEYVQ